MLPRPGLERAKTLLGPGQEAIEIAQEKVAQEQARGESVRLTLEQQREELLQQKVALNNQIAQIQIEHRKIRYKLKENVLTSPVDGSIVNLKIRNLGQTVTASETIATIAPTHSPLVLKAQVLPQDIGKLALGQAVKIRVTAYPYPDYGTLDGTVTAISPDVLPQEDKPHYEVTVKPDQSFFERGGKRYPLKSGMEARADIVTKEETLLSFILKKARLMTDI